jgi:peptide/nickel transport system substrate-binding protein
MKKRITILVFVAVLFAVCAPEAESAPTYSGTLRLIRYVSPGTPIGCPWEVGSTDRAVSVPALESLLRMGSDLSTEPMLATAWKIAPDKSSITFTLRKGVKFHDGTDWNAEAAKFNLEAFKAAKKAGTELWTSIKAIDDYTVQVNLSRWENTTLEDIGTALMISPTAFKTMGIDGIRWRPVGTGAFTFVSHERDVSTKFKKFDGYWQKGKPYLGGLDMIVITDPVTQSAAMEAGQGDALWSPNIKVGDDLKAMGFESIYRHDGPWQLLPDSANRGSPFADKRVREAVEYSIDREAIMKAFGYGFWQPAYQVACPYNVAGYIPDLKGRKYDPDKARALLKDAGYPTGFKTKLIPYPGTSREIMAALQNYLGAVGIAADLEFPDMAKLTEYRRKGWNNACMAVPWTGYANLGRTLSTYVLSSSADYVSFMWPAGLDELIKEALGMVEIDRQKFEKVVRMMFDEAATIPCWYIGSPRSLRKGIVHDTGFLAYSAKDDWAPENAWLSK